MRLARKKGRRVGNTNADDGDGDASLHRELGLGRKKRGTTGSISPNPVADVDVDDGLLSLVEASGSAGTVTAATEIYPAQLKPAAEVDSAGKGKGGAGKGGTATEGTATEGTGKGKGKGGKADTVRSLFVQFEIHAWSL